MIKKETEESALFPEFESKADFIDKEETKEEIVNSEEYRTIEFTLHTRPVPKQSIRFGILKITKGPRKGEVVLKDGQPITMPFKSKKITDKEKTFKWLIRSAIPTSFKPFKEIVHVEKMHYVYKIPTSFSKKLRDDIILNGNICYKNTSPDLMDNLKKLLWDCMKGIVVEDDGIVVSEDNVKKYYGNEDKIVIKLRGK